MNKNKYIIGTGWWCSEPDQDDDRKVFGDQEIRGESFHYKWAESVTRNTSPIGIVMIDSNSPISPPKVDGLDYQYIKLNENAGHVTNMKGKYCGWSRSILLGLEYASLCDCDYFVYVEQDVLLGGEGIIEECIKHFPKNKNYMFGKETQRPQPIQQSFFIIKKEGFDRFISNYRSIKPGDPKIAPEIRFCLSTSKFCALIPKFVFFKSRSKLGKVLRPIQSILAKLIGEFAYLPVGYGRERPIGFGDDHFYFQHASADELEKYKQGQDKNGAAEK